MTIILEHEAQQATLCISNDRGSAKHQGFYPAQTA